MICLWSNLVASTTQSPFIFLFHVTSTFLLFIGTCIDQVNSFKCQCLGGYKGHNCSVKMDECRSSPCVNGGRNTFIVLLVISLCLISMDESPTIWPIIKMSLVTITLTLTGLPPRHSRRDVSKMFTIKILLSHTGGSVGWASGCHAGGCEFDSGRTNTRGLKITEEKVLLL